VRLARSFCTASKLPASPTAAPLPGGHAASGRSRPTPRHNNDRVFSSPREGAWRSSVDSRFVCGHDKRVTIERSACGVDAGQDAQGRRPRRGGCRHHHRRHGFGARLVRAHWSESVGNCSHPPTSIALVVLKIRSQPSTSNWTVRSRQSPVRVQSGSKPAGHGPQGLSSWNLDRASTNGCELCVGQSSGAAPSHGLTSRGFWPMARRGSTRSRPRGPAHGRLPWSGSQPRPSAGGPFPGGPPLRS